MSGNNTRITELFDKYLANTASPSEEMEFLGYVEDPLFKRQIEQLISDNLDKQETTIYLNDKKRRQILNHILKKEQLKPSGFRYRKLAWQLSIAASIILCIGIVLYVRHSSTLPNESTAAKTTEVDTEIVSLDSTQVYLTLASGQRIVISDGKSGEIAQESGVTITKSDNGQLVYSISETEVESGSLAYNMIETPKGGQYQISLPDGTQVWLNANSSLKYPVSFKASDERKVFLRGEGYFEVATDKRKPFRVTTDDQQEIEVLGTHFNINAYNQRIKTALLEGAIKISSSTSTTKSILLKSGQMAVNDGNNIIVSESPFAASQIAWRDGYFVFNDANIREIMEDLANWYDLEVDYQGDMSKIYFHGNYMRSRDVQKLLQSLEMTNKVRFETKGRRITVIQAK